MIVKLQRTLSPLFFALLCSVIAPFVHANLDTKQVWDLPHQDLSKTLIAIGAQSEISIIFPSNLTDGLQATEVVGNLSSRQALDAVLHNTPLTWRAVSSQVVSISRKNNEIDQSKIVFEPATMSELIVVGKQITGSRLKRLDYEGSAPVDIITNPELEASGVQTVSEYLKFIPAVSGNSTSTSVSNGGDGTATITLRGLPASNTLVLINGKRTSNSGMAGDSVDLNSIPIVAVERIEVLKDGASAIYGSDAIAGVVNIILHENYDGLTFEQYFGESSRGDLTTSNTGIVAGTSYGNSDLMLVASHYDQDGIYSRDRVISANADGRNLGGADLRSSATPFTRIGLLNDDVVILSSAQHDPNDVDSYRAATDEDLYNHLSTTSSVSPSKRSSIYASIVHAVATELTAVFDMGYTKSEATVVYAPYPLYTAFESLPVSVGADNPYNPFDAELYDLRRRLVELGPRFQNTTERAKRLSGKLDYQNSSFHWDVGLNWNETEADLHHTGLVNLERVTEALSDQCVITNDCVPLDLFGAPGAITASQIDFIEADIKSEGISSLYEVVGNFDTTIDSVVAAPIALGVGISVRKEAISLLRQKEAHIGLSDAVDGGRSVWDVYAEIIAPLVQYQPGIYQLELEIASRYSHYNDFGSANNPKLGLRYRPVKNLLLRSTHSKGFRAPSLYQMLKEESLSYNVLVDPCTQVENVGVLPACAQQADPTRRQFATYTGGNLNLQPEKATSTTFGVVWTPQNLKDLYFSVDWFSIYQKDIIDARAQFIINQNAYYGLFDDLVDRDAAGNLVAVYAKNLNVGNLRVEGLDASIRYRLLDTKLGNFVFSINGSNLRRYQQQLDTVSKERELAGSFVDQASEGAGALPDWKLNAGFSWSRKNWEFNYNIFYVSSLTETVPFSEVERDIDSWTNQSLQLNYLTGKSKNIRFGFGIDNIFDQMPPFAASAFNDNFDQRTYELKGRNYYAHLKYHF